MIILIKQILTAIIIPLVLIIGGYLTIKLKFLQFTKLKLALLHLISGKTKKDCNSLTSFSALAAVIGGNLGTGNIAGIAVALSTGGPGALFWMWIMALLGAIIKFVGCYLAVKYRIKKNGLFIGGPMYYLKNGLNSKIAAFLFCIFTVFASLSVGNLVQVNSVAIPLNVVGIMPIFIGLTLSVLLGFVLFGGLKFFSYTVSKIVPFMTFIYIIVCVFLLFLNFELIIPSIIKIIKYAFVPSSIAGGALGYGLFDAIRVGFDRGLFATDAGVGVAPILHSEVISEDDKIDPAMLQGLISIIAPVIVMIICMLTGLVLMVTDTWATIGLESTNLCIKAFNVGLKLDYAGIIVMVTLFLFAFTTMLTWAHCGEKALDFLNKNKDNNKSKILIYGYRILFIALAPVGTYCSVKFVWTIADIALNCMLFINLIGVFLLSRQVIEKVKKTHLN